MSKYTTTAIIMAAGSSKRFGDNKLLAKIGQIPVLVHTIRAFQSSSFVTTIMIVTSEVMKPVITKLIKEYSLDIVSDIIIGGKERQDSVYNAIEFIHQKKLDCSYVVIHDGARPLVNPKDIDKCIQGAVKSKATTLAVRPKDTIKQAESAFSTTLKTTIPRETLWLIQTPQAFDYTLIYEAHERAKKNHILSTDDCALVENAGVKPLAIEGSYKNIKITTPEDIIVANVLLNSP